MSAQGWVLHRNIVKVGSTAKRFVQPLEQWFLTFISLPNPYVILLWFEKIFLIFHSLGPFLFKLLDFVLVFVVELCFFFRLRLFSLVFFVRWHFFYILQTFGLSFFFFSLCPFSLVFLLLIDLFFYMLQTFDLFFFFLVIDIFLLLFDRSFFIRPASSGRARIIKIIIKGGAKFRF